MAILPPEGGAGQGSGFQLFTQSNNDSGVYADAAARDVYFGANPSELARLDANESLIIKLLDDGFGDIAYQQRSGGNWVDVTSLVQGETGPPGASGNSYFFESIAARDAFFNTVGNEALLMNELPVVVNETDTVTTFFWNGSDSPGTYDEELWRPASLRTAPGTLFLGAGGASISSGSHVLNFTDADLELSYVVDVKYDDTGSTNPIIFDLGTRIVTNIADVFSSTLADPQDMQFNAAGNTLTRSYSVRPATVGELRIQAWAGTLDTDPVIIDQITTVEIGDIGTVLEVVLTNPTLSVAGDDILVRFSGIQLDGGLQTSGLFNGQTVPFLDADIHIATETPYIIPTDARSFYFAEGGDDTFDGLSPQRPVATIQSAVDKVNALSPPPSAANPSSIVNNGFGRFDENIVVPEGCLLSAVNVQLVASSGSTLTMLSNSVAKFDEIINTATTGDCILIDGNNTITVEARLIGAANSNSNGVRVTGDSSSLVINIRRIDCAGPSAAGIFDESTSGSPRIYNIDEITLTGSSSIGIFFDPSDLAAEGILNIGSITESAATTQGVRVDGGFATMTINDLDADTALIVNTGGRLNITANKITGTIVVNGLGVINAQIIEHSGTLTIAGTSSTTGRFGSTEFSDQQINGSLTATGNIEGGV